MPLQHQEDLGNGFHREIHRTKAGRRYVVVVAPPDGERFFSLKKFKIFLKEKPHFKTIDAKEAFSLRSIFPQLDKKKQEPFKEPMKENLHKEEDNKENNRKFGHSKENLMKVEVNKAKQLEENSHKFYDYRVKPEESFNSKGSSPCQSDESQIEEVSCQDSTCDGAIEELVKIVDNLKLS